MIRLLITSGRGPGECRLAVSKIVRLIEKEAISQDLTVSILEGPAHSQGHGPASVVLIIEGESADALASTWAGNVQWIAKSPIRPNHKRKNWFVSVSILSALPSPEAVKAEDVTFEAFRAGGPGGQHQNTTDSAVRVTHRPTGTRVVVREERSQHRNRAIALERLAEVLALRTKVAEGKLQDEAQALHDALERGNPTRVIK